MRYSDRILSTPSSFIRDILKVTQDLPGRGVKGVRLPYHRQ